MGRAIDMENSIDKIIDRLDMIEPALEKVINWISEQESKDDKKKQHNSKVSKKSAKADKKVSDVSKGGEL